MIPACGNELYPCNFHGTGGAAAKPCGRQDLGPEIDPMSEAASLLLDVAHPGGSFCRASDELVAKGYWNDDGEVTALGRLRRADLVLQRQYLKLLAETA